MRKKINFPHFARVIASRKGFLIIATACLISGSSSVRPLASGQVGVKPGIPQDWSSRHVIFSKPASLEQSYRVANDPRYLLQAFHRFPGTPVADVEPEMPDFTDLSADTADAFSPLKHKKKKNQGLWGQSTSATGTAWASSGPNLYPAKFGYYDTTTTNCGNAASPDYVVHGLKSGTVATQTGTFTGNPTAAQNVTLGGSLVLTPSVSTAATGTITLTNAPKYQDTASVAGTTYIWQQATATSSTGTATLAAEPGYQDTITVGSTTYTWLNSVANAEATGTITLTHAPNYQDTATIGSTTYIWQLAAATSSTGTVTLTTEPGYQDTITVGSTTYTWLNSVANAEATGTITLANAPAYQDTATIGGTTYIWQLAAATSSTGTITLTNAPNANDTVTVGATTYIWKTSCAATNLCVVINSNTTTAATNLKNAISGTCGGNPCTANASATATSATNVVSLTAKTAGTAGNFALSLPVNTATNTATGGNNAQNSCAGVNFCVQINASTTTAATNLKNAVGGTCAGNACAANASVTATSATNVVTLTSKTTGSGGNFTLTLPVNAAGNTASGGNNGTNACTGVNLCIVRDPNTTTSATNLKNAIGGTCGGNACAANTAASATSATNVVTLTAKTAGTAGNFAITLPVNTAGNTATGGSNAQNSCSGVNFCVQINSNTTTAATNLKNAVAGTCGGNTCAANSAVTATSATNVVTLTATAPGAAGNFTLTLPVNTAGNSATGGNNGTNACTGVNFCIVRSSSTTTSATNLAAAINGTCGGNACAANTAASATSATNVVTLTAKTAGTAGNFTLSLPVNTAGNTVSGGSNAQNSCTGVNFCVAMNASTTTAATNLKNAIGGTCAGNACAANANVTATSATNVVTLTSKTIGTAGNFTVSLPVNTATNTASGGANGVDGANTGLNFQVGVSLNGNATNLAAAISRSGPAQGITATAAGAVVTVQTTIGGTSVSLASTLTGFTWAVGTVAGTLTGGSSSQATIVAYDNLYVSCTGTVPSVYWSYNTSTTTATSAQVVTSPVISADGSQIAFVETSGGTAYLVVLRWKSGQGTSATVPVTPGTQSTTGAAYVTCKAGAGSCQLTVPLGANDITSSPFVDFTHDILYVGDASGKLHQMTGVFKGTPTLDTTNAGWPVTVDSGTNLTSPVYDSTSNLVFVGDGKGKISSVGTGASPAVKNSNQIEFRTGGIADTVLIDSSTGFVYAFVSCDATCSNTSNNAVVRFATSFAANTSGTKQILGVTGTTLTTQPVYAGTFDNIYYTGAGNTGNLYACGYTTGAVPILFKIPMSSTWGSATVSTTSLANGIGSCSPLAENLSGVASTDWLFLSVTANGNLSGCTGDCIYSFNIFTGSPVYSAARSSTAGTGGIIIDNSATATGASQIYFLMSGVATTATGHGCPAPSNNTAGGCALQAAQSSLQ